MKTAQPRAESHERKRSSGRKPSGMVAIIPPEARRSTVAALVKHAPGWTGNDLEDVIATVKGTRTKTRFCTPARLRSRENRVYGHDLWIAASAIEHNAVLVSDDSDYRRMSGVSSLEVETWLR